MAEDLAASADRVDLAPGAVIDAYKDAPQPLAFDSDRPCCHRQVATLLPET